MKITYRFILCLGATLLLFAACEGGFVEPKGRLIVENQSASAITSVQTQPSPPLSSVWFERWTGHAEQNSKIKTCQSNNTLYCAYSNILWGN